MYLVLSDSFEFICAIQITLLYECMYVKSNGTASLGDQCHLNRKLTDRTKIIRAPQPLGRTTMTQRELKIKSNIPSPKAGLPFHGQIQTPI